MNTAQTAIIRVSFDAEQTGGNLLWRVDASGGRNLLESTGRFAGAVHFQPNDAIYLEVRGSGRLDTFLDARILAAHLITRPHTGQNAFSAPSPFSSETAVVPINAWTATQMIDEPAQGLRYSLQQSTLPLHVIQKSGRWELSLALTVAITLLENGVKRELVRAFFFDPESEVGDGTDPD